MLRFPYPRQVEEPSIYETVCVHTAMQTGRHENDLVPNAPAVSQTHLLTHILHLKEYECGLKRAIIILIIIKLINLSVYLVLSELLNRKCFYVVNSLALKKAIWLNKERSSRYGYIGYYINID